jgi:uncharacterized protein YdgA (DUF945 family)
MIKISELKQGDLVMVDFDGTHMEGEVMDVNNAQKLAQVRTNGQNDFWYGGEALLPMALNDASLQKLSFQRQDGEDGSVKYMKGAFRVQLDRKDDFSNLNFWYREDRRHVNIPISVHQLQNYYHDMTKVHLTQEAI